MAIRGKLNEAARKPKYVYTITDVAQCFDENNEMFDGYGYIIQDANNKYEDIEDNGNKDCRTEEEAAAAAEEAIKNLMSKDKPKKKYRLVYDDYKYVGGKWYPIIDKESKKVVAYVDSYRDIYIPDDTKLTMEEAVRIKHEIRFVDYIGNQAEKLVDYDREEWRKIYV